MLGRLCLFQLELGITKHECGRLKTKFNEGIINATNSREITFAKTQQRCTHGKKIIFFIFGSGWDIGKLEIRERQA
jgi:hypothetical protein